MFFDWMSKKPGTRKSRRKTDLRVEALDRRDVPAYLGFGMGGFSSSLGLNTINRFNVGNGGFVGSNNNLGLSNTTLRNPYTPFPNGTVSLGATTPNSVPNFGTLPTLGFSRFQTNTYTNPNLGFNRFQTNAYSNPLLGFGRFQTNAYSNPLLGFTRFGTTAGLPGGLYGGTSYTGTGYRGLYTGTGLGFGNGFGGPGGPPPPPGPPPPGAAGPRPAFW